MAKRRDKGTDDDGFLPDFGDMKFREDARKKSDSGAHPAGGAKPARNEKLGGVSRNPRLRGGGGKRQPTRRRPRGPQPDPIVEESVSITPPPGSSKPEGPVDAAMTFEEIEKKGSKTGRRRKVPFTERVTMTLAGYADAVISLIPGGKKGKKQEKAEVIPKVYMQGWTHLTESMDQASDLSLDEMIQLMREGTVVRSSTVGGPPTGGTLRYAEDTPLLARYLGVCQNCKKSVKETDFECPHCQADLIRGHTKQKPDRVEVRENRIAWTKRGVKLALLLLVLLYVFTGWIEAVTPAPLGRRLASFKVKARAWGISAFRQLRGDPEAISSDKKVKQLLREAGRQFDNDAYMRALQAYDEIAKEYPEHKLTSDHASRKAICRIRMLMQQADLHYELGDYPKALETYREIKEKFPDNDEAASVDEKIADVETLLKSGLK